MLKNRIIYNAYSPWIFNLKKAEGSYLWMQDGAKLIDFSSGWNVTNLGWNHPEIAEAIARQATTNVYAPMWSADSMQEAYAAQLTAALPAGLDAIGRATGGTEANEMALKIARAMTGRSKIIGIKDSYHGQSFGDLALGFRPEYVTDIAPVLPDVIQIAFPSPDRTDASPEDALKAFQENLETLLKNNDVAAVLTEPGILTGWGTLSIAPEGYLAIVRDITKQYGTLLIVDEVGTGFSRCGTLFAVEQSGVTPDIVTLAKGISNGAGAIGAVVTTAEIANATYAKAKLTSTFGWTPLACAAAQKTLEIHQRDNVWQKAKTDGEYIQTTLKQKLTDCPLVRDIRGLGMEIGIELTGIQSDKVVTAARANGLHLAQAEDSILQLMPPLAIERPVLDEGIAMLVDALTRTPSKA